jgi:hypothetical protein
MIWVDVALDWKTNKTTNPNPLTDPEHPQFVCVEPMINIPDWNENLRALHSP